jgi:hypothetical protein
VLFVVSGLTMVRRCRDILHCVLLVYCSGC